MYIPRLDIQDPGSEYIWTRLAIRLNDTNMIHCNPRWSNIQSIWRSGGRVNRQVVSRHHAAVWLVRVPEAVAKPEKNPTSPYALV